MYVCIYIYIYTHSHTSDVHHMYIISYQIRRAGRGGSAARLAWPPRPRSRPSPRAVLRGERAVGTRIHSRLLSPRKSGLWHLFPPWRLLGDSKDFGESWRLAGSTTTLPSDPKPWDQPTLAPSLISHPRSHALSPCLPSSRPDLSGALGH